MEPITSTIAIIFLTKALEKIGERFGEVILSKVKQAIDQIRKYSPETAEALEAGNESVLNLGNAVLEKIPPDPIYVELLAAAKENEKLQQKLKEIKKDLTESPNKLAEKIGIVVQDGGKVDIKEFKM